MNKKTFIAPAVKVTAMETQNMILATSDGKILFGTGTAEQAGQNNKWTLN